MVRIADDYAALTAFPLASEETANQQDEWLCLAAAELPGEWHSRCSSSMGRTE